MAYQDFKSYIQANHEGYLLKKISSFVNENHDDHGFHSINVMSLCDQNIDKLEIKSLRCVDMPGLFMKIDINVTADIVTMGPGKQKYEAGRKNRWFSVHTVVDLRTGFEFIDEKTRVEEYAPGTFDKASALEEFMVPYVYAADLEDIADDFFEFYCQDAIYDMYKFPYGHVLKQMDIEAYEADFPENTMGRMYFKTDKATVYRKYPYLGESKYEDEEIKPGTMLISKDNYFMQKTGCYLLTIAHEIVHWYYHKKFFQILSLLDETQSMMNCVTEPQKYDENMSSLQKAMWFVEWQANSIGMRIAMPQALFVQVVQEAYASAAPIPRMGSYQAEVIEDTIHRVAKLFDVSDFAAKQRAIQLGWDVAAGTHIYVNGHRRSPFFFKEGTLDQKQSFVIDDVGLKTVCEKNSHIRVLLESKQFVYLGYVVCINDDKYLRKVDKWEYKLYGYEYDLNKYAIDHVDECCLIFDWESISGTSDDGGFYGQCYLSKDISANNRVEHYYDPDFENNQSVESIALEIKRYKEAFAAEEEVLKNTPDNFRDALVYHMDRKHITLDVMAERSGLSRTTIVNYRSGKRQSPNLENMMALFIGLNLSEKMCDQLLDLSDMSMNEKTTRHKVYRMLIREHSDGTLEQWNMYLREFGLVEIPDKRNQ